MHQPRITLFKTPRKPRGRNSETMQNTIEANVDARTVWCDCCGKELESKGARSRLCSGCTDHGCDPATAVCQKPLGDA